MEISKLVKLEVMLQQFDYYHEYSDDHQYWLNVDKNKDKISELLKELYSDNKSEIDRMFQTYWNSSYINWKDYFGINGN